MSGASGATYNDTVNFLIEELQELGDYYSRTTTMVPHLCK